uniref:Metaxin n=1 Tax=Kalanchoe fedtschenkoi TaxID=63787 RepID=A0A7N0TGL9_KALFE
MDGGKLTLVARKPCFGLPTACPKCLPAYIYLKFAKVPFDLDFNLLDPDSERIPYVESGGYVAYNNEKGGVIEGLKDDGVVDLDSRVEFEPDWLSANAVITSWLTDAVMYELWVASDESPVHKIYYSDLARPIGKIMFLKQSRAVKQLLGVNGDNADHREKEIYRRATRAYKALSSRLGDETFFFDSRPTSVDANFLAHALFTLQALPETSTLRSKLLEHTNVVSYAEKLRKAFVDPDPSSTSVPQPLSESSTSDPKSSHSSWRSRPKSKPKKEKTEEEKTFRRRAKYFLGAQAVAILVFLTLMAGADDSEVDLDEDDDFGHNY